MPRRSQARVVLEGVVVGGRIRGDRPDGGAPGPYLNQVDLAVGHYVARLRTRRRGAARCCWCSSCIGLTAGRPGGPGPPTSPRRRAPAPP